MLYFEKASCNDSAYSIEILSEKADLEEAAKNLYAAMHRLDKLKLDAIIIEKLPDTGLGKSINDRLERASKNKILNYHLLIDNLTNPALLFFILGIIAVLVKSDLEIPQIHQNSFPYLLFAIGFKGGQELSHETFNAEIAASMLFGIAISMGVPLYTFFLLKKQLNPYNAAAIAAAYGSVSAVTFVTAVSFEIQHLQLHGHMVAIMALMESPAIIVGLLLLTLSKEVDNQELAIKKRTVLKHAFTNGSVLLILGSLCIGFMANAEQAQGIKPLQMTF